MRFSFEVLQQVMELNNIAPDTKMLFDNASDYGVFGVTNIFYHEEYKVLMLAGPSAQFALHDGKGDLYEVIDLTWIDSSYEEFDLIRLCADGEFGWNDFDQATNGMICSQCPKIMDCSDADKAECMRKFINKEGYDEVQYKGATGKTHTGLTKWKLLWSYSW